MAKASDNIFPKLIESMNTADPTAPSDSSWKVYAKANGIFARSSNSIVGPFSSGAGSGVATDAIWTTSGKVAVATGTATATEQWPPGHEFDYVEKTSNTTLSATTEATATTIVTGASVTYDGSTVVMVEVFCYNLSTTQNQSTLLTLYDGSGSIGLLDQHSNGSGSGSTSRSSVFASRRLTPSNAAHTYSVRGFSTDGAGVANAGAGGSGNGMPFFMRIKKV